MNTAYISGPLTNVKNPDEIKNFYNNIGDICSKHGIRPYIPHQHSDPIDHPNITSDEVYALDYKHVSMSDLVIAYVGEPSHGVGQEVEIAREHGIPIVLIYENKKMVSKMILGNPCVKMEIVEFYKIRNSYKVRFCDTNIAGTAP